MTTKDFDGSWFKLEKYDGLKELDLLGWYQQIIAREWLLSVKPRTDRSKKQFDASRLEFLKQIKEINPIFESGYDFQKVNPRLYLRKIGDTNRWISGYKYSFNTATVQSTTLGRIRKLGTKKEFDEIWKLCDDLYLSAGDSNIPQLVEEPYDLINLKYDYFQIESIKYNQYLDNEFVESLESMSKDDKIEADMVLNETYQNKFHKLYANITVDLNASNEQIIIDFTHWLRSYKKAIGYKTQKTTFTTDNFKNWITDKLLPFIDLHLIAKLENTELTLAESQRLLKVPNENKVQRTVRDNAGILMSIATVRAMEAELRSLKKYSSAKSSK